MWTTAISFPESDTIIQDSAGFVTHNKGYTGEIPASILDATRQDEQLANQDGYRADVVAVIDRAAYNGAGWFIDSATGYEYDIKRVFRREKSNLIQLTGQRRIHGKT